MFAVFFFFERGGPLCWFFLVRFFFWGSRSRTRGLLSTKGLVGPRIFDLLFALSHFEGTLCPKVAAGTRGFFAPEKKEEERSCKEEQELAGGWKGAKELGVFKFAFKEGAKELPVLEGHGRQPWDLPKVIDSTFRGLEEPKVERHRKNQTGPGLRRAPPRELGLRQPVFAF